MYLEILNLEIPDSEITVKAARAGGPGGQHVNKVSTAVQLRFDIPGSSLPDQVKEKLLSVSDRRISQQGVILITAQRFRSQEMNKKDALKRLEKLIAKATAEKKARKKTKPTRASVQKRLEEKQRRSQIKEMRKKVDTPGESFPR